MVLYTFVMADEQFETFSLVVVSMYRQKLPSVLVCFLCFFLARSTPCLKNVLTFKLSVTLSNLN